MSEYLKERDKIAKMFSDELYRYDFQGLALEIFRFQYQHNNLYRNYCEILNVSMSDVHSVHDIPFLPIIFFKNHSIKTGEWKSEVIFRSSGTTQSSRSEHHIRSQSFYVGNTFKGFSAIYGDIKKYSILAILPGYEDRRDSSLIYMVNFLIESSDQESSGFYLGKESELIKVLENNQMKEIPTILFGVSFGLLELTAYSIDFPELIVIETGGMKSSKIEMPKKQIIEKLKSAWKVKRVDSEYGMTELQSQAYALNSKWYTSMATMKVNIGQLQDPFAIEKSFKAGNVKVIDLANFDTCSFIETEDLGMHDDRGHFQVLGRMHNSELRGCNLLLENFKN